MGELELVAPEGAKVALALLMLREELAQLAAAEAEQHAPWTSACPSAERAHLKPLSSLPAEQNRSIGLSSLKPDLADFCLRLHDDDGASAAEHAGVGTGVCGPDSALTCC